MKTKVSRNSGIAFKNGKVYNEIINKKEVNYEITTGYELCSSCY